MSKDQRLKAFFSTVALLVSLSATPAFADTIFEAMAAAYNNNATLNAARADARATDENVPLAKSAMRPQVSADAGVSLSDSDRTGSLAVGSFGINIDQVLFDGNQTRNNVAAAEAQVRASQYGLANSTQNVLFDAAAAYSDVFRDRQIAGLRQKAIAFLTEQQRAAQARFQVGEGTRTDVAQADAQRAGAIAQATAAQARVKSSEAVYRQVTGLTPGKLKAPVPAGKSLPKSLESAFAQAESNHPAVLARLNIVDASDFNVKAKQGQLLPQLSARARVESQATDSQNGSASDNSASLSAQLRIPIYTGGRVDAQVRQSKEQLAQARLLVDESRDQVRAAVASAWANLESARAVLNSSQEQIDAAQVALNGLIEERNVGQRTTLDVLNGQNQLLDAQIARVQAERDVVVASYAVLSAIGALKPEVIGLNVQRYDPQVNFEAVKDKWFGLRTVDGR
ncbi:MAG: TolC family outer membrane protein [Rhizobiaceae bacterium]|jgi:outer membrane protein|nr:TolC family outer membrane protein [Rhizobiaceae bacterium]